MVKIMASWNLLELETRLYQTWVKMWPEYDPTHVEIMVDPGILVVPRQKVVSQKISGKITDISKSMKLSAVLKYCIKNTMNRKFSYLMKIKFR